MVIETKLPRIDSRTKNRVMEYFEKVSRKATVKVAYRRDGLPESIKLVRVIYPEPKDQEDPKSVIVNDETMYALIATFVDPNQVDSTFDELDVVISRRTNKNADGIPCGSVTEQYKFSGENLDWLLSLAQD